MLGSGGKVLTLVNLGDVYMEIYLPAQDAVKVKIGADARIVLDIAPEYAARAKVTFVAPEAQFTPKQVETRSERDKLMFRVKLSVPPERVLPYIERVKTGIRGVGYVRLDDSAAWPERLDRPFPGPAPAPAGPPAAAGKPEAGKRRRGPRGPDHPTGNAGPPTLTEGDAMASPSMSVSTPPNRDTAPVVSVRGVSHVYGTTRALDALDLDIPAGCMVGLIGPDGVGKSTLMGLIAGSKKIQAGAVRVLGGDMAEPAHRDAVCPRIAFMPQGLGKNLYLELSVFENIDFFARLFGVSDAEREPAASRALLERHRPGAVPRPPRRQALRRHEAEGRPLRRPDPRPRPAHPRRADHRRRSSLPPAVLVPHRPHPRPNGPA